jgi:hypothetical protein
VPHSGTNFKDKLEIKTPFQASGTIETGDYDVARMYVGVLQLKRNPETEQVDVTAAAYGMGSADLKQIGATTSEWTMELRADSEHPKFEPGRAVGFVLVELAGGRVTGWVDDTVELVAPSVGLLNVT